MIFRLAGFYCAYSYNMHAPDRGPGPGVQPAPGEVEGADNLDGDRGASTERASNRPCCRPVSCRANLI